MNVKNKNIIYLYIGKRIFNNKTLMPCFYQKGNHKERIFFKRVKGVFIGHEYYGDGADRMKMYPDRVSDESKCSEETITHFEAEEMVDRQIIFEHKRKLKSEKEIKEKSKSKRIRNLKKEIDAVTEGMSIWNKKRFLEHLAGF